MSKWKLQPTTEEGGITETKFNSALASLERLHKWFIVAGQYSFIQDCIGWKSALDNVYKEVVVKLSTTEEKELNVMRDAITVEFDHIMLQSTQKDIDARFIPSNIHKLLEPFEIQLRKYADKHGLLIPGKKTVFDFM